MLELTQQERRVILFLLTVALFGWGIDSLAKRYSNVRRLVYFSPDICKVDLNTADKEMLMTVSGVGEKLAGRIIGYRQIHGDFSGIEELKNITGISESKYNRLKNYFIATQ